MFALLVAKEIGNLKSRLWDLGTRIKGMEMALVCHDKASRTALQTGSLSQTHTCYRHTHMTTVMDGAEQCRQL